MKALKVRVLEDVIFNYLYSEGSPTLFFPNHNIERAWFMGVLANSIIKPDRRLKKELRSHLMNLGLWDSWDKT